MVLGHGPAPSFVLALIEGIPAGSMLAASQHKNPELLGWDRSASIGADIYDALMFNTRATGQWRKSPPRFAPYPRPSVKPPKKEGGLAALYARVSAGHKHTNA